MSLDAVDKVLDNPLVDLAAQLEVVHEDVLHRDGFQDLMREQGHTDMVKGRARQERVTPTQAEGIQPRESLVPHSPFCMVFLLTQLFQSRVIKPQDSKQIIHFLLNEFQREAQHLDQENKIDPPMATLSKFNHYFDFHNHRLVLPSLVPQASSSTCLLLFKLQYCPPCCCMC